MTITVVVAIVIVVVFDSDSDYDCLITLHSLDIQKDGSFWQLLICFWQGWCGRMWSVVRKNSQTMKGNPNIRKILLPQ